MVYVIFAKCELELCMFFRQKRTCTFLYITYLCVIISTRKAKAAYGRLSFELGYNQTITFHNHNLQAAIQKLHVKFRQNWYTK